MKIKEKKGVTFFCVHKAKAQNVICVHISSLRKSNATIKRLID